MIQKFKEFDSSKIKDQKFVVKNHKKMVFSFKNNNKTYYFKAKSEFTHIHNEIMCNILALKLGLINSKMIEAVFVNEDNKRIAGIVSQDYLPSRKNKEVISLQNILTFLSDIGEGSDFFFDKDRSIVNLVEILFSFANQSLAISKKKITIDPSIKFELAKLSIFWVLTGQSDFNNSNIEFILENNQQDNTFFLTLAPFIDNSISFFQKVHHMPKKSSIMENPLELMLSYRNLLYFKHEKEIYNKNEELFKDIAKSILTNKEISSFYEKIKKINFRSLITEAKEKYGHTSLTDQKIEIAETYFNTATAMLEETYEKLKTKLKERKQRKILKQKNEQGKEA